MIQNKITEEELEFMECLQDPICLSECLFSDIDNLSLFTDDDFSHLRMAQIPMLSYEYLVADDPNLTKKQNFKLKEGAGTLYNVGARKYGKTIYTLIIDMFISVIHLEGWECLFSSYDYLHILNVMDKFSNAVKHHPFFRLYKPSPTKTPNYLIKFNNNFTIVGINQNIASKTPGAQFFGRHTKKHWMDECSKETEKVKESRIDSVHELGCIDRHAGMTDFTKHSPIGKVFYDLTKQNYICNQSQYCNPMWDADETERAKKLYGGENTIFYKIFVKGEICEDGVSVIDMQRARLCYDENKQVKFFEIPKEAYISFEEIIVVRKPRNAEAVYISVDVGESASSEIMVWFLINGRWRYEYNVTLYNLTDKEQYLVLKWLGKKLSANLIGLDTTDGTARAIYRRLAEDFPKENLCWVHFSEKIPVDFEKNEKDEVVVKDGKPVYKEELIDVWSIKRLRDLLYERLVVLPMDYKLDNQLNSVKAIKSKTRITYKCVTEDGDHLLASMRVFAIMQWLNEFNLLKPIEKKEFSKTGV